MGNKKEITEQDLIDACKYGYDYHKTSKFPYLEFEEMAINNFKQVLQSKKDDAFLNKLKSSTNDEVRKIESGERVTIEVGAIEFNADGDTIWVQSPLGSTTMRIKCNGKIKVERCNDSPLSHCDIITEGDIKFCVSNDVE